MTRRSAQSIIEKYTRNPRGTVNIVVPFHDVDVMEVVWHGHYSKYFEVARCAVLSIISYDYPQMRDSGYMWPIVDTKIRYVSPARYGDVLDVTAIIVEWELRLVIKYILTKANSDQVVAKGSTVQVPIDYVTGEMCFGCPNVLNKKINAWKEKTINNE